MRASIALLSSCLAVSAFTVALPAQQPAPLTVDAIYAHGSLLGNPPSDITWSPDGNHLSYIDSDQLIDLDPAGSTHVLISRAKMKSFSAGPATEQQRDHRSRYEMPDYIWAPDSQHILFDANGRLWLFNLKNGTGIDLGSSGMAAGTDPKFSPDGKLLALVRNHNLAVMHFDEMGQPTRDVAEHRAPGFLNGEVAWVYAEELDVRSDYFWSPDSKNLAYLESDQTHVPLYPLTDWLPTHATVDPQSYPQAGDANPTVHVGIVKASGGRTRWIDLPIKQGDDYIPRFGWIDANNVWIETLTRDHQHRTLYFANIDAGGATKVLDIADDKFLAENYDITVRDGYIVYSNWNDGFNHVYLYSYNQSSPAAGPASLVKQLTSGSFDVSKILRVDPNAKLVTYLSNEDNLQNIGIWQVTFDGQRKKLSTAAGTHTPTFSPDGEHYVDEFSTRMTAPEFSLCATGGECKIFWQTRALEAYGLPAPESITVKAHDGTPLFATLLLPAGKTDPASVPLIVNPYGGPGPMNVANKWGGNGFLFDELLAQHGFAVLHADNRGEGMRGRTFAQFAYRNFGAVQFEDQMTVVDDVLAKYPQLDPKRLGWWGWSWGGTFTLYAMSHSDRFRAGVSVAPVTDFRNYDSVYTERYLGLPQDNPDVYNAAADLLTAKDLHGHLLLVHGTGDDNVHMENTIQYIQALIQAQKPYDLQLYPRKTHSIAGRDVRTHLYTRILNQFEQYLMPPAQ